MPRTNHRRLCAPRSASTLALLAALIAPAAAAHADTVTFSVLSGTFASTGTNVGKYLYGSHAEAHLTFTPASTTFSFDLTDGQTVPISSFGTFTVKQIFNDFGLSVGPSFNHSAPTAGDPFTLTLQSVDPTPATNSTLGLAEGLIGPISPDHLVSINVPSLNLPRLVFSFDPIAGLADSAGNATQSLSGTVTYFAPAGSQPPTAVPLPAASLMGLATLLPLSLKRRRR